MARMALDQIGYVDLPPHAKPGGFEESGRFYVNIADPPRIVVIDSAEPSRLADSFPPLCCDRRSWSHRRLRDRDDAPS